MYNLVDIKGQQYTFFGENSIFSGKFKLQGTTHIAGKLDGEIEFLDMNSTLHIEPEGSFIGDISCHHLNIFGTCSGEINAEGVVTFFPTSIFEGEVKAKQIIIHPGAVVNLTANTTE